MQETDMLTPLEAALIWRLVEDEMSVNLLEHPMEEREWLASASGKLARQVRAGGDPTMFES